MTKRKIAAATRRLSPLLAALLAAATGCVTDINRPRLPLAADSRPLAEILLPPSADSNLLFAASELKLHLDKMTGADFPIVTRPTEGRTTLRIAYNHALSKQASAISFSNAGISLESGEFPEYAVWDFLHDYCGVRWLDPTDAGTYIPWRPNLSVAELDRTDQPFAKGRNPGGWHGGRNISFYSPELWLRNTPGWTNYLHTAYPSAFSSESFPNALQTISSRKKLFLRRMKAGGEYVSANHSFYGWYDRFWDKTSPRFERHRPELFAVGYERTKSDGVGISAPYDGTQRPPQLCYSNPEVVRQAAADIRAYFDRGDTRWGKDVCCVEPMDNSAFCLCPRCRPQYHPELRKVNSEHSDYWFRFVNAVAREVAKTHPGKKISTLAYWSHCGAPSFPLAPNVVVHYCFTFNRLPYSTRGWNREMRQLHEWRSQYPDRPMGVWLYNLFPRDQAPGVKQFMCFPGFFAGTLAVEYRHLARLGVTENIYNCGFIDDYENFLSLRWMWNPLEPLPSLEKEYFASYGAAAKPIREFYHLVEDRYCSPESYVDAKFGYSPHQTPVIAWTVLGTPDLLARLAELMSEAERLADTPLARARVANWKSGIYDYIVAGASSFRSQSSNPTTQTTTNR